MSSETRGKSGMGAGMSDEPSSEDCLLFFGVLEEVLVWSGWSSSSPSEKFTREASEWSMS